MAGVLFPVRSSVYAQAHPVSADCGISANTAKQWFSVLEGGFITFRLPPHSENFRKKTVKTPKIDFINTALACRLIGIETPQQLETHPLKGNLFENWVVSEIMKVGMNRGRKASIGFWRGANGLEVDLVLNRAGCVYRLEACTSLEKGDWKRVEFMSSEDAAPVSILNTGADSERSTVFLVPTKHRFFRVVSE